MPSKNKPLISQLDSINEYFASCVRVIIHVSEMLTKGSNKNDFSHSMAVYRRLSELFPISELFPNANNFFQNEAEIFILIASAYLHDIGHSNTSHEQRHGKLSADMIINNDSLKFIFPAGDILNQVAKICDYHDRKIEEIGDLEKEVKLDIRACHCYTSDEMIIRPRMLSAVFRLADELECNSDRMLGQPENQDDPRTSIAGVRIDLELRCIWLDFKHGTTEEKRNACVAYLRLKLVKLGIFLKHHGLSFKIVDKSPETKPIDEEEGVDEELYAFDNEEVSEPSINNQNTSNFNNLNKKLKSKRMNRINRLRLIFPERGTKND